jgi:hypothetical protein
MNSPVNKPFFDDAGIAYPYVTLRVLSTKPNSFS